MSIQSKAACCYLFYSPLPRVFSSGYFLSWMFLAVNSTEFFCVCCPSLVTSAVSSTNLLTHAQTFILELDFVCCCLHFWELVNWCYGKPFQSFLTAHGAFILSLLFQAEEFLHTQFFALTYNILTDLFPFYHILLKRDQNCRNIKNASES